MEPFRERIKITNIAMSVMNQLIVDGVPLFSNYYIEKKISNVCDRNECCFDVLTQSKILELLTEENIIAKDYHYSRMWKLQKYRTLSAQEKVCLADPLASISHLSALYEYKFTEVKSDFLHLTISVANSQKEKLNTLNAMPLYSTTSHPNTIGETKLFIHRSSKIDDKTKRQFINISNIPRTFFDTLDKPQFCGGISHVLKIWDNHAIHHIEDIIDKIENYGTKIIKVRAGYIIEERLNIKNPIVENWKIFAQRGGSRRLDPSKKYKSTFSEKWMLSINI
ncbi:MAG: hypothetical protein JKY84_10685 [Emcibacteraceae bacterium]|nr:hypothetical protein [Emcibacteraceae bacterium]